VLLLITGTPLNVSSFMGLILLVGLIVKNGIILLDFTRHRMKTEGLTLEHAISEAGRVRLRPILMTTLCTLFGLLPLALGLGAVLFPLRVQLPGGVLVCFAATPVLAGVALIGDSTPRAAGAVLLVAFALGLGYVVMASRTHRFLDADEVLASAERPRRWWMPALLTLLGIGAITVGAELVTFGAQRMISQFSLPAALIGMVVTPAAIELEEVIRQAVPAHEGRPDVSAGNLVGTVLYFVLFNLGLIALASPVQVSPLTRTLDWPFLVGSCRLATLFLGRGGVSRVQGSVLLALYAGYVGAHVALR